MMFYAGQRPWHGLGQELAEPATAEEAIKAAGLDWEVQERKVYCRHSEDHMEEVLGWKALIRGDSHDTLSIQRDSYTPIQNTEAFEFFDEVVGEKKAIYHTAGGLGKGERVWILAKLPDDIVIKEAKDEDRVEKYLLLFNSHDGTSALRMIFTPVRVVCNNTLTWAMRQGEGQGISIRHTKNAKEKVAEAQRALGLAVKYYDDLGGLMNQMAMKKVTKKVLQKYLQTLVPDNPEAKINTRTKNIRDSILTTIRRGRGSEVKGVKGTWWAAYNGVTEYIDHERKYRGDTDRAISSSRMRSIVFGSGARAKDRALTLALKMAKVE
jgi:phage/plasmid-like protein (TIGR03299 family)